MSSSATSADLFLFNNNSIVKYRSAVPSSLIVTDHVTLSFVTYYHIMLNFDYYFTTPVSHTASLRNFVTEIVRSNCIVKH